MNLEERKQTLGEFKVDFKGGKGGVAHLFSRWTSGRSRIKFD